MEENVIKRWFLTALLVLLAGALSFAEVRIKPVDENTVEITFLFEHLASEMNVIGSFDNWTVPGEAMTKNAEGKWEKTITAAVTDEIQYKFYVKDVWIFDELAPDKKDDGYGGNNGLIVVADILSGATVLPVSGAPVAGETAAAATEVKSKLNFGTTTVIGSRTTFSTQGLVDKTEKGIEADETGFYAKSNINFNGTIVPDMNVYLDMKILEGYKNIWAQDSRGIITTQADDGARDLVTGLLTNPVNYMNGDDSNLKALKTGIETPYVNWETGYGEAHTRDRQPVFWKTISPRNGDDGYTRLDLGSRLTLVGPGKLEAGILPNRFGGEMGAATWIGYDLGNQKIDFQYDVKSAQKSEISRFFDKLYHQDFLLGYKIRAGNFEVKTHGLLNLFSESDFDVAKDAAGAVELSYDSDGTGFLAGYRFTEERANMLFGDNDGAMGAQSTQRVLLNLFAKPSNAFKGGFDSNAVIQSKLIDENAIELYVKPWTEVKLDSAFGKTSSLNAYAKFNYTMRDDYVYVASDEAYLFGEGGLKWYLAEPIRGTKGIDVYYGFNNWDKARVFHSLMSQVFLPGNAALQFGTGVRLVRDNQSDAMKEANNLMGFALGGWWKLPAPKLKTPMLYGAFVYNMDGLGEGGLDMSDYVTKDGADKMNGKAQLRVMLKWEF